jgi:hypothetical protein
MAFTRGDAEMEALNARLDDSAALQEYKRSGDGFHAGFLPRILGGLLIACGNSFYGHEPSYLKFRAIEVIARVPYHSWSSAAYTLLTMFYFREKRAIELSRSARYAGFAQENETMHVVVITQLARAEERANVVFHTLIPIIFSFFYFWAAYWLHLVSPRASYELNYLFEDHAFEQYSDFLEKNAEALKQKPVASEFLAWYGRTPRNQYEFFRSVRNDEVTHRNHSFDAIQALDT